MTIDDIATGLDRRAFTCLELVEAFLGRTEEVNKDFCAVIEVNPDARDIARKLDEELKEKGRRGHVQPDPGRASRR